MSKIVIAEQTHKWVERCDELNKENSLLKKQLNLALKGLQEYAKEENWRSIYDFESFDWQPLYYSRKWKEDFGYKYAQDVLKKIKEKENA